MSQHNGWDWVLGLSGDQQRIENIPAREPVADDTIPLRLCTPDAPSLCPLVLRENNAGGEARTVVMDAARVLGVDLTSRQLGGQTWSFANMSRIVTAAAVLKQRAEDAEAQNRVLRNRPQTVIINALNEAADRRSL